MIADEVRLMILQRIKKFLQQETVLCAAMFLGITSSFWYTPKISYIDFEVLSILLALMLVVAGLKSVKFLDWIAVQLLKQCQDFRAVAFALVGITYVSSMFVTNDVALITFVPLALIVGKTLKLDMGTIIIYQTLAANLGSMFTPPGNPQNLFLFSHYHYTTWGFFKVMLVPTILALVYLGVLIYRKPAKALTLELPELDKPDTNKTPIYLLLLLLNICAVLHVFNKYLALGVTVLVVLALQRRLLKQVDYSLLLTFVGFFVFIGNISHSAWVLSVRESFLGTPQGTYLAALVASQFISNVPAAMLLAGLTNEADALLLGVNIGGLGTLIASMASVISYKLFVAEHPYQAATYLKTFLFYNVAGLVIIGGGMYLVWFS